MHGARPLTGIDPCIAQMLVVELGLEFMIDHADPGMIFKLLITASELFYGNQLLIAWHLSQFFVTFATALLGVPVLLLILWAQPGRNSER